MTDARCSPFLSAPQASGTPPYMTLLRLNAVHEPVVTLGPSPAVGIWVQYCAMACRGCASQHTWDPSGGVLALTSDVAAWMNTTSLDNLTVVGGEPMEQAPAVSELIDDVRRDRDWLVTCYSGFTIEALRDDVRPGTAALLDRLDILIDGPYVAQRHAALLWRGSSNQRIHDLSGRATIPPDTAAGVMPVINANGSFELVGVYPDAQFLERLEARLGARGIHIEECNDNRSFPFPVREES